MFKFLSLNFVRESDCFQNVICFATSLSEGVDGGALASSTRHQCSLPHCADCTSPFVATRVRPQLRKRRTSRKWKDNQLSFHTFIFIILFVYIYLYIYTTNNFNSNRLNTRGNSWNMPITSIQFQPCSLSSFNFQ